MTNSTFSFAKAQASGDYATPHGLNISFQYAPMAPEVERFLTPLAPAGALWSSARDMARYLITELNQGVSADGQRVVSQKNLAVTWEPQIAISADASYGLGWIVARSKGLRVLMHGGNTLGFSTDLTFLPEANLGIVILANAQYSNLFHETVRSRLIEMVFDQPQQADAALNFALETQAKGIEEMTAGLQASVDTAAVAPYLGTFASDVLGEITLAMEGDKLVADIGEFASELRAKVDDQGKTTYLFTDPPLAAMGVPFELQKDEQGNPIIVIAVPPDTYTFRAAP
jgi:CubicO group peptidase (beta-lactamase class C family)